MRSLRARVTLAAALAGLLVLAIAATVAVTVYAGRERKALDVELSGQWSKDAERLYDIPADEFPTASAGSGVRGRFSVAYHGRTGKRIWNAGNPVGLPRQRWLWADVEHGGDRWRVHTSETNFSGGWFGRSPPVLVVAQNTRDLDARIARVRIASAAGTLVVTGLLALAVWVFAGVGLAPLKRLRTGAHDLGAAGDLTRRLPVDGPPELAEMVQGLNRMLDRLQIDYRHARSALDATRTFTADAGHELRTPLTSLRANLDVLSRDGLPPGDRERALRDALSAHSRVTALIDGLQTLARGDAAAVVTRSDTVDLAELADAAVLDAGRRHGDVAFELEASPQAPVEGDADGLRMLLDNLLENAAVHGASRVRALVRQGDGYVRLSVDDDGPGIPDVEKGRVFERFARGSAARNGTGSGLGLAIAAQQAELHGGRLKLDDSPLGGARFELTLSARATS